jgi:hypothetical protein
MRVGAYPGTFDPPTVAHLAIAEAAAVQCGLARIDLVVNSEPLGKADVRPLDQRVAMLDAVVARRPWLRVVVTDQRHLADIAEGYDVLVLGADKWVQVLDVTFYADEADRDAAVARLPQLAIAPRQGLTLPGDCIVLEIDAAIAHASSTSARAGRHDLVPPEVRRFL